MSLESIQNKGSAGLANAAIANPLASGARSQGTNTFDNYLSQVRRDPAAANAAAQRAPGTKVSEVHGDQKKIPSDRQGDRPSDGPNEDQQDSENTIDTNADAGVATEEKPTLKTDLTVAPGADSKAQKPADSNTIMAADPMAVQSAAVQSAALQSFLAGGPDASRFAATLTGSSGMDRKGALKTSDARASDLSLETAHSDTPTNGVAQTLADGSTDLGKASAPSRLARIKELGEPELSTERGRPNDGPLGALNETSGKAAGPDFASLLGSAIGGTTHLRQTQEFNLTMNGVGAPALQSYDITAPLESAQFGSSLASHLSSIVTHSVERAEIQLNPKELGPIRVEISVKDRETHVVLIAAHAHTVDAIEQSSPMLRTLLGEQGLTLGQFEVRSGFSGSDRSPNPQGGQDGRSQSGADNRPPGSAWMSSEQRVESSAILAGSSRRLLDLFA